VLRYELDEDWAGAGRYRGGLGCVREIAFTEPGGFSVEGDGSKFAPWGFAGGCDGHPGDVILNAGGADEVTLPSKVPYRAVRAGDRLTCIGPAGGGYGRPDEREPQRVRRDLEEGFLTPKRALDVYGVVVDPVLGVDEEATRAIRARRLDAERTASR
jgi:N-methylhydantoinase B